MTKLAWLIKGVTGDHAPWSNARQLLTLMHLQINNLNTAEHIKLLTVSICPDCIPREFNCSCDNCMFPLGLKSGPPCCLSAIDLVHPDLQDHLREFHHFLSSTLPSVTNRPRDAPGTVNQSAKEFLKSDSLNCAGSPQWRIDEDLTFSIILNFQQNPNWTFPFHPAQSVVGLWAEQDGAELRKGGARPLRDLPTHKPT